MLFRGTLSQAVSIVLVQAHLLTPHHRDDVLAIVKKQMEDGISLHNPTVALMNASILSRAGVSEEEQKFCTRHGFVDHGAPV